MTNAKGIPKSECSKERSNCWLAGSDFEPSDFFRHSDFNRGISRARQNHW